MGTISGPNLSLATSIPSRRSVILNRCPTLRHYPAIQSGEGSCLGMMIGAARMTNLEVILNSFQDLMINATQMHNRAVIARRHDEAILSLFLTFHGCHPEEARRSDPILFSHLPWLSSRGGTTKRSYHRPGRFPNRSAQKGSFPTSTCHPIFVSGSDDETIRCCSG
jgi:hypothetical protein